MHEQAVEQENLLVYSIMCNALVANALPSQLKQGLNVALRK